MMSWCDVIAASRDGQKASAAPAIKTFGTKLSELLAHEKQTRRGPGDVPSVVRKCVEFLSREEGKSRLS